MAEIILREVVSGEVVRFDAYLDPETNLLFHLAYVGNEMVAMPISGTWLSDGENESWEMTEEGLASNGLMTRWPSQLDPPVRVN